MAPNPREAERALPSVEREAELRELVEAAIEAEARHADTYRKPAWECKNDAENRDAARRALFAAIDALRAENSHLRAVVGALQYGDGGRAPVSRLDPEREPDTAPSQFFAAGRCRVCGSVQAAGYYPTIEEAKEGAEAFRRVSGLADTFGPLLPGVSLTIAPRCDCEADGEGAL